MRTLQSARLRVATLMLGLTTLASGTPAQTAPKPATPQPVVPGSIATEVDAYAKRTGFSGTVRVEYKGKRLLQRHYGLADRSFAVPVDSATRFWVASITKLFTAALVMQQVEAGRIDLSAPINTYLPDYKGPATDRVTVRQLLNHTSGLEQFEHIASYGDAVRHGMPEYQVPHTPSELLASYASGTVNTPPGSAFNYNNADYIVLGAILERVAGMSYEQLVASQTIENTKHRFAQRPGRIMGANVTLLRYLDDDLTVIILGNTNLADIDRFGFLIGRTVLR